jgi:hypothetical protein
MLRSVTLAAALYAAAPVNAQTAWWTPAVPATAVVWWVPPCDCGNCGDPAAQRAEYAQAYDKALAENKPLVLFVGQKLRRFDGAMCVRYDGADLPVGLKSPCVIVGRGCGPTMSRTALLVGEPTDREIMDALRQQPVCPTCPQQQNPFRLGKAEPELSGLAGLLAASMVGSLDGQGVTNAQPQAPPVATVSAPFAGSFTRGSEPVFVEARRLRAPLRRLFSLPFRAIRRTRANRVEFMAFEPATAFASSTVTRYETVTLAMPAK